MRADHKGRGRHSNTNTIIYIIKKSPNPRPRFDSRHDSIRPFCHLCCCFFGVNPAPGRAARQQSASACMHACIPLQTSHFRLSPADLDLPRAATVGGWPLPESAPTPRSIRSSVQTGGRCSRATRTVLGGAAFKKPAATCRTLPKKKGLRVRYKCRATNNDACVHYCRQHHQPALQAPALPSEHVRLASG